MTDITTNTSSNAPTHIAYHVRDGQGSKKGFWTRIGAAWPHADGQGFSVQVDCLPLDGRLTIRVAAESKE